jgi:hypothetical protein
MAAMTSQAMWLRGIASSSNAIVTFARKSQGFKKSVLLHIQYPEGLVHPHPRPGTKVKIKRPTMTTPMAIEAKTNHFNSSRIFATLPIEHYPLPDLAPADQPESVVGRPNVAGDKAHL